MTDVPYYMVQTYDANVELYVQLTKTCAILQNTFLMRVLDFSKRESLK